MVFAGFWRRAIAIVIDGLIINLTIYLLDIITGGAIYQDLLIRMPAGQEPGVPAGFGVEVGVLAQHSFIGGLIQFFGSWLYFAAMESSAIQATPGKMLLGIFVTDLNGRQIGFGRATGRYFAKFLSALVLGIGFFMAAFSSRKQALHDMVAETLVMKRDGMPGYGMFDRLPPPPHQYPHR